MEEQQEEQLINIISKEGQLTVSSREIAENFEKRHSHTLRDIEILIGSDSTQNWVQYFIENSYKDNSGKRNKEYLLTRDGFGLLIMGFTGVKSLQWKLKYIEAFNRMEQELKDNKPTCIEDVLIQSLKEMKDMRNQINQVNHNALEAKAKAEETKEELQEIRDVITLDHNSWREDCRNLISRIAVKLGGYEHIRDTTKEVYSLMDNRLSSRLSIRLTNKRRRMADEGVCKSKRDKLSYVDVIADDKKLIEGYKAIVKEMAIKYGIS